MNNVNDSTVSVSAILLCRFEACCYLEVAKVALERNSCSEYKPRYGCENGFSSFIFLSLIVDCSVYVYEAIKMYSAITPEATNEIKQNSIYSDLEVVRNNVHTFNKRGSYREKAETIILEKLDEYKMLKRDIIYPLRNDISLVFQISEKERHLIGSDYLIKHCIYESSNKEWSGEYYKEYAEFVSSIIYGFSQSVEEMAFMIPLPYRNNEVRIELFDYKSADLFARINTSKTTAFRLLLMLSQISFGIIFLENILDKEKAYCCDLWVCFLTKVLAIRYDEAFDNLCSLLDHAEERDKVFISNQLNMNNIHIGTLKARQFARGLRNTIHYQQTNVNPELVEDDTTVAWIKAIYLTNSEVETMDEFRELSAHLVDELKALQAILQKAFALDKSYTS